ncbi:redox-regulated ATPase YchF [Bacteroidetes/Chlorobi group bacterium Naka2016]|jgi:GTP-binding protein YchF|nr:MAG: redox-regulated ATPase YchF [Bacteroidetes/Chlorobi group bacterium Naka2016]
MKIGIVGLPYSGKTTFFESLISAEQEPAQGSQRKSTVSIIKVPDERLDYLTQIFNPKRKVNATIEVDDFMGSSNVEIQTYNSKFATVAKNYDAFILIVRGFEDPTIPHIKETIDIKRDINLFFEDTSIFDLSFIESRLERLEKELTRAKNKDELLKTKDILIKWNNALQEGIPLRELDITKDEELLQKNYQMLTMKPLIVAVNLSESDIEKSEELIADLRNQFKGKNIRIEPFFAKIEYELSRLSDEERIEFMENFGLKESALSRLLRSAYNLLGLQSFFTVGEDECRAWTIRKGMTAQEAAGVIHTDFYNKFIRAEVVHYNDFKECGSFAKCKEKGVFRLEGKDYIVQDGDIMHIRHN